MSKKRTGFFIDEESLTKINGLLKIANCKSRNEFVNEAIQFYIAYLNHQNDSKFIICEIEEMMKNVLSLYMIQIIKNQNKEYKIALETLRLLRENLS